MNTGHAYEAGPKGAREHALGLNDSERAHTCATMAGGRKGGRP
jgi:hypothetical protein